MDDRHPYLCVCPSCRALDDNEWCQRTPFADIAITPDHKLVCWYIPRRRRPMHTIATWEHRLDDDTCMITRFETLNEGQAISEYMEAAEIPDGFKFRRSQP